MLDDFLLTIQSTHQMLNLLDNHFHYFLHLHLFLDVLIVVLPSKYLSDKLYEVESNPIYLEY